MSRKCLFCGAKADLLCDSWLGWERKRGEMAAEVPNLLTCPAWGVPLRYRAVHTCDAPLCRACSTPAGHMHIRLRNGPHIHETIDYCPGHDRGDRRTEITGLQAEAKRARWRSSVRGERERREGAHVQPDLFSGGAA